MPSGKKDEAQSMTSLSRDSPNKNVGVLGKYISRIIEDRQKNPHMYLEDSSDTSSQDKLV